MTTAGERARSSALENFIERVGINAEAQGLPRIAGRMMAFFVLHGGPVSFGELAQWLNISRGSVSTNTRVLMNLGVIERVGRPGDRQDYFQITENPYRRLIAGHIERMREMHSTVSRALAEAGKEDAETMRRLREMQSFYQITVAHMEQLVEKIGKGSLAATTARTDRSRRNRIGERAAVDSAKRSRSR